MAVTKGYDIYTPDGFGMYMDKIYSTPEKAEEAFLVWIKRYEKQGYYSTSKREQIPLTELRSNCNLIDFEFDLKEFLANDCEFI